MDIEIKKLLNEYMDVLFRLTVADHWFNALGNKNKCTINSKEYIDLCILLDKIRNLYMRLRDLNINPPRWINDNIELDKNIKEYREGLSGR